MDKKRVTRGQKIAAGRLGKKWPVAERATDKETQKHKEQQERKRLRETDRKMEDSLYTILLDVFKNRGTEYVASMIVVWACLETFRSRVHICTMQSGRN